MGWLAPIFSSQLDPIGTQPVDPSFTNNTYPLISPTTHPNSYFTPLMNPLLPYCPPPPTPANDQAITNLRHPYKRFSS
ncbi:hypothetical protein L1887_26035 [Cichorium endivia]|nr:hypothetical protein L1887_26035 [Cichorium endivia]